MTHFWTPSSSYDDLPQFAVAVGYDCDCNPNYVGRAKHHSELLPAKAVPAKGCAYVSWGGEEHVKNHYEVLVGQGYVWRACGNGSVPNNAVFSGHTSEGEPLYVGRGHHNNSLCMGKVHPSHGCLYIPYGGQDVRLNTYEVLVCENNDNWQTSLLDQPPTGAVVAGCDSDYTTVYVARSYHDGRMVPAKFVPSRCEAYICYEGEEINKSQIEVLCGYNYNWEKAFVYHIPQNAVFTGHFDHGEPLFVGRAHHNESLTPGLVDLNDHCLLIPYRGEEVRKTSFEILTRH